MACQCRTEVAFAGKEAIRPMVAASDEMMDEPTSSNVSMLSGMKKDNMQHVSMTDEYEEAIIEALCEHEVLSNIK